MASPGRSGCSSGRFAPRPPARGRRHRRARRRAPPPRSGSAPARPVLQGAEPRGSSPSRWLQPPGRSAGLARRRRLVRRPGQPRGAVAAPPEAGTPEHLPPPRGRTVDRRRRAPPSVGTTTPRRRVAVRSAPRRVADRRPAHRDPRWRRAACAARASACALCNRRAQPRRSCRPATAAPPRRARRRSPRRRRDRGRGWRSVPPRSRYAAGPPCVCRAHVRDRATHP